MKVILTFFQLILDLMQYVEIEYLAHFIFEFKWNVPSQYMSSLKFQNSVFKNRNMFDCNEKDGVFWEAFQEKDIWVTRQRILRRVAQKSWEVLCKILKGVLQNCWG